MIFARVRKTRGLSGSPDGDHTASPARTWLPTGHSPTAVRHSPAGVAPLPPTWQAAATNLTVHQIGRSARVSRWRSVATRGGTRVRRLRWLTVAAVVATLAAACGRSSNGANSTENTGAGGGANSG